MKYRYREAAFFEEHTADTGKQTADTSKQTAAKCKQIAVTNKQTAVTNKQTGVTSKQTADTGKQTAATGKQTADFEVWILLLDIANRQENTCLWLWKYRCRKTDFYTHIKQVNTQLNSKGNARKLVSF